MAPRPGGRWRRRPNGGWRATRSRPAQAACACPGESSSRGHSVTPGRLGDCAAEEGLFDRRLPGRGHRRGYAVGAPRWTAGPSSAVRLRPPPAAATCGLPTERSARALRRTAPRLRRRRRTPPSRSRSCPPAFPRHPPARRAASHERRRRGGERPRGTRMSPRGSIGRRGTAVKRRRSGRGGRGAVPERSPQRAAGTWAPRPGPGPGKRAAPPGEQSGGADLRSLCEANAVRPVRAAAHITREPARDRRRRNGPGPPGSAQRLACVGHAPLPTRLPRRDSGTAASSSRLWEASGPAFPSVMGILTLLAGSAGSARPAKL
jgi:hypothetical protein